MFVKTLTVVLLLFFTVGVSWAMGARIHPEAFSAPKNGGEFVEITFKTGQYVVGKKTFEDRRGIHLKIEGGTAIFSRDEIADMKTVAYENLPESERELFKPTPFFTMRREDALFYKAPEVKRSLYSPGHAGYEPKEEQS